jgi:DNA polymerase sigma
MSVVREEKLQEIVGRITAAFPVRKVMVFGSYAAGDVHDHSDLNLCVVVEGGESFPEWPSKSWLYRAAEVTRQAASEEVAVDARVFTEKEFQALMDRGHPLLRLIVEEGRVVYEQ